MVNFKIGNKIYRKSDLKSFEIVEIHNRGYNNDILELNKFWLGRWNTVTTKDLKYFYTTKEVRKLKLKNINENI